LQGVALSRFCGKTDFVGRPTIYALGDSHSHQFFDVIAAAAKTNQYNYVFSWGSSCLFPSAFVKGTEKECYERGLILERNLAIHLQKNDIVFLGNALHVRFGPSAKDVYYDVNGDILTVAEAAKKFTARFAALSDMIEARGAKLVLNTGTIYFANISNGELCRVRPYRPKWAISDQCFYSLQNYIKEIDRHFSWRRQWSNKKTKILWEPYIYDVTCDDVNCDASLYRDSNHLTDESAFNNFRNFLLSHKYLF
jgi:hypothetical protein